MTWSLHSNSQQLWLPAQDEASHYSGVDWGGAHKVPPVADKLLAADGHGNER